MYALITGASSGIGKEMAVLLARRGYDLILTARRMDRLEKLQQRIEDYYKVNVIVMPFDLSKKENCISLFEECKDMPIEVVINNAGFGKVGEFDSIPLDQEVDMIETNITAVHILTKLFAGQMKKGHIMNVSSIAAFQPIPLMSTYGATKSYVLSLSKAVNYEMKRKKKPVIISTLCPGPVDTEFDEVAKVTYSLNHITAKECAKAAIRGMFQNKTVIFPVKSTQILSVCSKLAPDCLILPIEYYLQNQKRTSK